MSSLTLQRVQARRAVDTVMILLAPRLVEGAKKGFKEGRRSKVGSAKKPSSNNNDGTFQEMIDKWESSERFENKE